MNTLQQKAILLDIVLNYKNVDEFGRDAILFREKEFKTLTPEAVNQLAIAAARESIFIKKILVSKKDLEDIKKWNSNEDQTESASVVDKDQWTGFSFDIECIEDLNSKYNVLKDNNRSVVWAIDDSNPQELKFKGIVINRS